ncbi:protein of unknown function [Candidatus Nitrosotalea okcheonensis]|uniref:Uncharacterized protein n=1 Tax=Candidatus Nitrosotalea okcheonensis TaxID=1903276 RepID=A0A2H1FCM7_9ARCH|nr:protein of unknown function [Candidatus Nitrosotalea okcheonensis]
MLISFKNLILVLGVSLENLNSEIFNLFLKFKRFKRLFT